MNKHTYVHIYIYACIHAYMHACIHTYICTYTYTYMYICMDVLQPFAGILIVARPVPTDFEDVVLQRASFRPSSKDASGSPLLEAELLKCSRVEQSRGWYGLV